MLNNELSKRARELQAKIIAAKSDKDPDTEGIEALRREIDAAADAGQISIKEWRDLVERCAKIRRKPRTA